MRTGHDGCVAIDQREVVRRDRDPEVPGRRVQPGRLLGRQRQPRRDLVLAGDAVAQLPAPVVESPPAGRAAGARPRIARRLVDDRERERHGWRARFERHRDDGLPAGVDVRLRGGARRHDVARCVERVDRDRHGTGDTPIQLHSEAGGQRNRGRRAAAPEWRGCGPPPSPSPTAAPASASDRRHLDQQDRIVALAGGERHRGARAASGRKTHRQRRNLRTCSCRARWSGGGLLVRAEHEVAADGRAGRQRPPGAIQTQRPRLPRRRPGVLGGRARLDRDGGAARLQGVGRGQRGGCSAGGSAAAACSAATGGAARCGGSTAAASRLRRRLARAAAPAPPAPTIFASMSARLGAFGTLSRNSR